MDHHLIYTNHLLSLPSYVFRHCLLSWLFFSTSIITIIIISRSAFVLSGPPTRGPRLPLVLGRGHVHTLTCLPCNAPTTSVVLAFPCLPLSINHYCCLSLCQPRLLSPRPSHILERGYRKRKMRNGSQNHSQMRHRIEDSAGTGAN